jgi:hypothetical protein
MPRFTIASVVGERRLKPALEELRSISSLARDRSRRSLDRLTELMEHEDGKVAVAACVAILKVGGALGQGERDAQFEAAVEARVMEIFARAKERQLAQVQEQDPPPEDK